MQRNGFRTGGRVLELPDVEDSGRAGLSRLCNYARCKSRVLRPYYP